jgi:hypothetical protein
MPYSVRVDARERQATRVVARGSLPEATTADVADPERSCAGGGVHAGCGGDAFGTGREGIGAGELEPCVAAEDDETEDRVEQLRHGGGA